MVSNHIELKVDVSRLAGDTLRSLSNSNIDLLNPIVGFTHFECEKYHEPPLEDSEHRHEGLQVVVYTADGMIWSENKLLTSGMLQHIQFGSESHRSALPVEQNGPVQSFGVWFWSSTEAPTSRCLEFTLDDVPIIRDEYNSTEFRLLAGRLTDCEAPLITQPDVLLCDLTLHRTAGSAIHELSVPKNYSVLVIYVWQTSHPNQVVVNVSFEGSTLTNALSYRSVNVFQSTGKTVTFRLGEHVNESRLFIIGGERIENLPPLIAGNRELQMTLCTELAPRFIHLFSGFGIAIALVTYIYAKYGTRLPVLLQYSFLYGKLKPQFDPRLEVLCVPKSWFRYFYLTGMVTTPMLIYAELQENPPHPTILVSLAVFFAHVIRRFYETVYISRFGKNQMSITHFMVGELLYCAVPVALHCTRNEAAHRDPFAISVFIAQVVALQYSQHVACRQLADLRKPDSTKSNESANGRYFVPVGSMFQHISCPHFLFEIALYLSFHWFLTARWTLFSHIVLFVFINQTCAAWIAHKWYQEHFPEWAAIRSALVPHIF